MKLMTNLKQNQTDGCYLANTIDLLIIVSAFLMYFKWEQKCYINNAPIPTR